MSRTGTPREITEVESVMRIWCLDAEAEKCRRIAVEFAGRPEEPFLLSVASAFEELACQADDPEARMG